MAEITQTQRHYPKLPEKHQELQPEWDELHSKLYDLRDSVQGLQNSQKTTTKESKPAFTGDIQGIKVKAVTDPSSLQNGYTIRFNSKTGEFEFGV
jgi:uncharacterized protein YlxW (UPF0749 family)